MNEPDSNIRLVEPSPCPDSTCPYLAQSCPNPRHKSVGSVPPRSSVLFEAESLINGDRNVTYGSPTQNFQNIADLWTVQLRHVLKDGEVITASMVAQLQCSLKLARMIAQPKRDNWVDLAGYAGCGYECDVEAGNA